MRTLPRSAAQAAVYVTRSLSRRPGTLTPMQTEPLDRTRPDRVGDDAGCHAMRCRLNSRENVAASSSARR